MTDKEIVQALHICGEGHPCRDCQLYGKEISCVETLCKYALALIERLTAEVADLRKELEWKDMVIALAQRKQAEAEAERDALREKQRWIPVTERLPEKQGWYHVAIRDEKTKRIAVEIDLYSIETAKNFGHEIGFCKDGRWDGREKVIAWMPLPEAPEGGEKDADCQRRD